MNNNYLAYGEKILLTLWVGSMWFAGYVVAPVLFQLLDKTTAGAVAGQIFSVNSYLGLFCGLFLMLSLLFKPVEDRAGHFRLWIIILMLCVILAGQFILAPMMVELKQAGIIEGSENASQFGRLHGVSSVLFLINSLLGLVLVIVGIRPGR